MRAIAESVKKQIGEMIGQAKAPTPILAIKPKELPMGRSIGPYVRCAKICQMLVVVGAIGFHQIVRAEVLMARDAAGTDAKVLPGASLSVVGGEPNSENSVHVEDFSHYLPLPSGFFFLATRLTTSGPGIYAGTILLPGGQSWQSK